MHLEEAFALGWEFIDRFLPGRGWRFQFDRAKRRAGLCDHTNKTISISRYFAEHSERKDVEQVLLHEVAHALADPKENHGPQWLRIARSIGYTGGVTHNSDFPKELATWLGVCPNGHTHFKFKKPTRLASCRHCGPGFDRRYLVEWRPRDQF